MSTNVVVLKGNLCADPELRQAGSSPVCKLRLANSQKYGETEYTTFVDVEVWGKQAESCEQWLAKGHGVIVTGQLRQDNWEQDGQRRSKHFIRADRVDFMPKGSQDTSAGRSAENGAANPPPARPADTGEEPPF